MSMRRGGKVVKAGWIFALRSGEGGEGDGGEFALGGELVQEGEGDVARVF